MFDGFAVSTVFYSIWHKINCIYCLFLLLQAIQLAQKATHLSHPLCTQVHEATRHTRDLKGWLRKYLGLLTSLVLDAQSLGSLSCRGQCRRRKRKDRSPTPGSYYICQATGVDCRCRAASLLKKAILRSALSACWPPVLRDKGGGMSRQ